MGNRRSWINRQTGCGINIGMLGVAIRKGCIDLIGGWSAQGRPTNAKECRAHDGIGGHGCCIERTVLRGLSLIPVCLQQLRRNPAMSHPQPHVRANCQRRVTD